MKLRQVTLFELNTQENIACRGQREEQVAGGHDRRGPKCNDESQQQGMAHDFVEQWHLEFDRRVLPFCEMQVDLAQAKEIEVIDQERAHEHLCPTEPEERLQDNLPGDILHLPN